LQHALSAKFFAPKTLTVMEHALEKAWRKLTTDGDIAESQVRIALAQGESCYRDMDLSVLCCALRNSTIIALRDSHSLWLGNGVIIMANKYSSA
jgi:hypothetical protein